ncbi:MAG: tRNA (adenosine(37)-N6)-threonylcarbamoyltransferase complex ATPase subunit type 1 TsaE [Flavobacteriales bacterium]|jgi:tRNA threonylcarbamoyladenosine biosynthesis protein TsaE|nr:tRNA (adenosine(37)-N6)-threonylcarbamoyltransferase complex ATPase subunit type 1 TsaE [Flavobacteriales bacterium]MBT6746592.1 tRNA (adenosine(37)-N6)-threonylcarbamoyltransferase complex ATPase subunit type 1 TsaE [Flavobacteriales bacterium]
MLQLESNSLEDLGELAKQIVNLTDQKIFVFYGEMGAGKTTLIKKIVEVLGSNDEVSSPTYSLVNEYFSETTGTIYHFDFYRIESEDEVFDIGYEDYLYSSHYCFIEWPEKIANLLPSSYVKVTIKDQESKRLITLSIDE